MWFPNILVLSTPHHITKHISTRVKWMPFWLLLGQHCLSTYMLYQMWSNVLKSSKHVGYIFSFDATFGDMCYAAGTTSPKALPKNRLWRPFGKVWMGETRPPLDWGLYSLCAKTPYRQILLCDRSEILIVLPWRLSNFKAIVLCQHTISLLRDLPRS